MANDADKPPSGFYPLFEGAIEVVLKFPVDGDSVGPRWDDISGEIDRSACPDWEDERVAVVPLGGNCYRLAERLMGPVSGLTLHWGMSSVHKTMSMESCDWLRCVCRVHLSTTVFSLERASTTKSQSRSACMRSGVVGSLWPAGCSH